MEEASCFGFEEDVETASPGKFVRPNTFRFLCNINGPSRSGQRMLQKARPLEESRVGEETLDQPAEKSFSITQVQELLLQDLNPSEFETLNSTMTNDSMIYEDDKEDVREEISPIKVNKKGKGTKAVEKQTKKRKRGARNNIAKEDLTKNENTTNENNSDLSTVIKTPARVFSRPVRRKKPLEEIQNFDDNKDENSIATVPIKKVTKKRETKKKIEEDEKIEKRIEEINAYFKEIEKHQLIVE